MKIRTKFILAFSVILALMFSSGIYMYIQTKMLNISYSEMMEDSELLTSLREMQFFMTGRNNDERAYLLTGESDYPAEMKEKAEKIDALFQKMKAWNRITDNQQQVMGQIEELYTAYLGASGKAVEALGRGNREAAVRIHFGEERQARKEMDKIVNQLVEDVQKEKAADEVLVAKKEATSKIIQGAFTGVGILAALLMGAYLVRSIVLPLNQVNGQLRSIAEGEGDLTQELTISSKDEIGILAESFNRMLRNLRELILQIRVHAEQVAASAEQLTASSEQTSKATEQIAETIQEMAVGTDRQAQNVEESHQEVEEMASGIEQIATRAQSVSTTAIHTSQLATEGNRTIQSAVTQMNSMGETMEHLAQMVSGLGARSQQIGQIVQAITEIAGQTNLLALNAAIEAARAGEHGRGFAVVADEVRKLAEQASLSANEITQLVEAIQSETTVAVSSMQKGTKEVAAGMEGVAEAGEVFSHIRDAVASVAREVQDVSAASRTLTESTGKVAQSMQLIAGVTQTAVSRTLDVSAATEEQLASMEEIHSSAASLAKLAEELEKLIGRFKA
jgi:methyl-accepting chemotaxis protein